MDHLGQLYEVLAQVRALLREAGDADPSAMTTNELVSTIINLAEAQEGLAALRQRILALPTEPPDHREGSGCTR